MEKFKKGWLNIVSINLFFSISISYVLFAYFYKFMSEQNLELNDTLLMPKEVFNTIFNHSELKVILPFVPLLLFSVGLYLLRKSIFDLKYDDASDFGVKGDNKFGNALSLMNDKVLLKGQKYGDLNKSLKLKEGIILGLAPSSKNLLILGDKTSLPTKNIFVNGSSGAGKGQGYVLNNIVNNRNESMIVIDPKGENFSLTAQLKRDQGYKVYNVDFRNFEYERYNPLDYVKNDEDAQRVSLIMTANSGLEESYFTERAQKLLAGLISYVKSEFPKEEANMEQVINVFNKYVSDFETCEEWLNEMDDSHPAKALLVSVLGDLESVNTRSSVTSSFQGIISIFQFNRIKRMTKISDFKFDNFVEEKTIVYVKIAAPSNPYKALTSVFISQMIERFFELGDLDPLGRLKTPIHFMLDEFANIGKIDSYQETLALCRGYRMYMHTIVQDVAQLEDKKLYGKEQTKAIISNHSVKILLKVGEKDSAKYWSGWFGDTTISYKKESSSYGKGGKTVNTDTVYENRDLVTDTELLNIDDNWCYILLSGHDPLYVRKAWQFLIYPDLLTDKNRELNYNNIRKTLGYTNKPESDSAKSSNDDVVNLFENYNKKTSVTYSNDCEKSDEQVLEDDGEPNELKDEEKNSLETEKSIESELKSNYELLQKEIDEVESLENLIDHIFIDNKKENGEQSEEIKDEDDIESEEESLEDLIKF